MCCCFCFMFLLCFGVRVVLGGRSGGNPLLLLRLKKHPYYAFFDSGDNIRYISDMEIYRRYPWDIQNKGKPAKCIEKPRKKPTKHIEILIITDGFLIHGRRARIFLPYFWPDFLPCFWPGFFWQKIQCTVLLGRKNIVLQAHRDGKRPRGKPCNKKSHMIKNPIY